MTYYFEEPAGRTRTITGANGVACNEADYYLFGGEQTHGNTCDQNYHFAGMYRDGETANDYTQFRMYESNLGRWMTPDPVAGDITNPQSLNRYAYVLNNPTNFTDPLGLDCTAEGQALATAAGTTCIDSSFTGRLPGSDDAHTVDTFDVGSLNDLYNHSPWPGNSQPADSRAGHGKPPTKVTFGVRAPGQNWTNCMSANSGNYSIAGAFNLQSEGAKFALGNDVSQITFGSSAEGTGGIVLWEGGSRSFEGGVGEVMTAGRRTASIMDLNLAGTTGPAPMILARTGAEKLAGWLSGVAELKFAIDVGLTGAQALGCAFHR